jgi:hypothetical protein
MYLKNKKNNELMREALEWMMISRCQTQTRRVGDLRSRDGQAWTMVAALPPLPQVKRDHLLCALGNKIIFCYFHDQKLFLIS